MASASVPGVHSWSNLHYQSLSGALGLSPHHGGGLRALFLFGRVVVIANDTMQRAWYAQGSLRPVPQWKPLTGLLKARAPPGYFFLTG
jgi:hypothetical protein